MIHRERARPIRGQPGPPDRSEDSVSARTLLTSSPAGLASVSEPPDRDSVPDGRTRWLVFVQSRPATRPEATMCSSAGLTMRRSVALRLTVPAAAGGGSATMSLLARDG